MLKSSWNSLIEKAGLGVVKKRGLSQFVSRQRKPNLIADEIAEVRRQIERARLLRAARQKLREVQAPKKGIDKNLRAWHQRRDEKGKWTARQYL